MSWYLCLIEPNIFDVSFFLILPLQISKSLFKSSFYPLLLRQNRYTSIKLIGAKELAQFESDYNLFDFLFARCKS